MSLVLLWAVQWGCLSYIRKEGDGVQEPASASSSLVQVGGQLKGLLSDTQLILMLGGEVTTISQNGPFTLMGKTAVGAAYSVVVVAEPEGQACKVAGGEGVAGASSSTGLDVVCELRRFRLGGAVRGLVGGVDAVMHAGLQASQGANGSFTFAEPVPYRESVDLRVESPTGHDCVLTQGSEPRGQLVMPAHNVLDLAVVCTPIAYAVSGQLQGLNQGRALRIALDNDAQVVTSSGPFAFAGRSFIGTPYALSVAQQPSGQLCDVTANPGVYGPASASVTIACRPRRDVANWVLGRSGFNEGGASTENGREGVYAPVGRPYLSASGRAYFPDPTRNSVFALNALPASGATEPSFSLYHPSSSMNAPSAASGDGTKLLVADTKNHRVLVWSQEPAISISAAFALGQPDLTSTGSACSPTGLASPADLQVVDGRLLVADAGNHRVLIWHALPNSPTAAPDLVLGQADLIHCSASAGPGGLSGPMGLWMDGGDLWVADTGNHRVLRWTNLAGLSSGAAASLVLGQPDMTSTAPGCSNARLNKPTQVVRTAAGVFVADTNNHRIAGWDPQAISSGAALTQVVGQKDADSSALQPPSRGTVAAPQGMTAGQGGLIVADTRNNRWLGFGLQLMPSQKTYYLDQRGSDADSGLAGHPWQSLARLSQASLSAGDTVVFSAGQAFFGSLYLSGLAGSRSAPITLTGAPGPAATIAAGAGPGIAVTDSEGVVIRNLHVQGSGSTTNASSGITFTSSRSSGPRLASTRIDRVEVSGFRYDGIKFWSQAGIGFEDVALTRILTHDHGHSGITFGAINFLDFKRAHRDVRVHLAEAYNITGDPTYTTSHSGSGIVLGQVESGLVQYSRAHENGSLNACPTAGPAGIWAWESDHVVLQYNEVYNMHNGGHPDGDGTDLDGGVSNSILQYNYLHDNAGPGLLVSTFSGSNPTCHNTVRYNLSARDGQSGGGAVILYGEVKNLVLHNNTIFGGTSAPASLYSLYVVPNGASTSGIQIFNNIFTQLAPAAGLVNFETAMAASDATLTRNLYNSGAPLPWKNGSSTYASLAAWQAGAGQESGGAGQAPIEGDPKLSAPDQASTLPSAWQRDGLSPLQLQAGSPALDAAIAPPPSLQALLALRDIADGLVPSGAAADLGALERGASTLAGGFSQNLLANPGFESAASGWTVDAGAAPIADAEAHSGSSSLRSQVGANQVLVAKQTVSAVDGSLPLMASVWVKAAAGAEAGLAILAEGELLAYALPANQQDNAWAQVQVDVPAGLVPAAHGVTLALLARAPAAGAGQIDWDDADLRTAADLGQAIGINRVVNPGFEADLDAWKTPSSAALPSTTQAHAGAKALHLGHDTPNTAVSQALCSLEAGRYSLSLVVYGDGTSSFFASLFDADGNAYGDTFFTPAANTWTRFNSTFSLNATAPQTWITLHLAGFVAGGDPGIFVDDVRIARE